KTYGPPEGRLLQWNTPFAWDPFFAESSNSFRTLVMGVPLQRGRGINISGGTLYRRLSCHALSVRDGARLVFCLSPCRPPYPPLPTLRVVPQSTSAHNR